MEKYYAHIKDFANPHGMNHSISTHSINSVIYERTFTIKTGSKTKNEVEQEANPRGRNHLFACFSYWTYNNI